MTLEFVLAPSREYPNGHWHATSQVLDSEADGESSAEALVNLLSSVERKAEAVASW